jgi:excisionase family DNA binding protein
MPEKEGLMPSNPRRKPQRRNASASGRGSEILDVRMAAELLTVSPDTVYELFKNGDLPGRKVGRKRITTKSAVLWWIEGSFVSDAAERAIAQWDREALAKALKSGRVRAKAWS